MQPSSPTSAASSSPLTLPAAELNTADRELLIDIDFFDAQGRWNPHHVVFCAAEDGARAKSLWTRCFRGFMALHGKLWAKNYLENHFSKRTESEQLMKQIKQAGYVDKTMFQSTVAQCTLLYENLEQVHNGKAVATHSIIHSSPIENIDALVAQYFLKIDWKAWNSASQFEKISLTSAQNITKLIGALKIDERNDHLINDIGNFVNQYSAWVQERETDQVPDTDEIGRAHV